MRFSRSGSSRLRRPSPALVIAIVALVVALGGTGYAALKLPKNSVGSKQIKSGAVNSSKVADRSLRANDFKPGQLPAGAPGAPGAKGDPGEKGDTGPQGPGAAGFDFTTAPDGETHEVESFQGLTLSMKCQLTLGSVSFVTLTVSLASTVAARVDYWHLSKVDPGGNTSPTQGGFTLAADESGNLIGPQGSYYLGFDGQFTSRSATSVVTGNFHALGDLNARACSLSGTIVPSS